MAARAIRRTDKLSHPKPVPPGFLEDRRSVYWVNRYPPCPGPDGTTAFVLTPRLEELAASQKVHDNYQGDRPTPIWPVSHGARSATTSTRLETLAAPRSVPHDYVYTRSVYTQVTNSAKNTNATPRLVALAEAKPYSRWHCSKDTLPEGEFSTPITTIPPMALSARCAPRVETLAEAKREHQFYLGERPVQWPVSENAKLAAAPLRLQQLARPKSGRMKKDDYDPYKVSTAARCARTTPRLLNLSEPIPRKVRTKKVV